MSSSSTARRRTHSSHRRGSWCCSFTIPPSSPETLAVYRKTQPIKSVHHGKVSGAKPERPRDSFSKLSSTNSILDSPQSSKSGLSIVGRIDPRRILSPGRVSPIDPDPEMEPEPDPNLAVRSRSGRFRAQPKRFSMTQLQVESFRAPPESHPAVPENLPEPPRSGQGNAFDVRVNLRSKKAGGGSLVLELNSEVLCSNSEVFAGLVAKYWNSSSTGGSSSSVCRIEVPDVENLGVFRETIELMFEDDIAKSLVKIGVYRSIDILEVSASIMFTRGVASCLKYIEAVPWTEEEEEKLRSLFTRVKFDEATIKDILSRLYILESANSEQNLAKQLVCSITSCTDQSARNELKSLVKGLLSRSSVYEKDSSDLKEEEIYDVCRSCLGSLLTLFDEASCTMKCQGEKPLVERISREVDNINWLLEILLDRQIAEDFVAVWADQEALAKLHEVASPMVRYELSRVSAVLFIAMGTRKLLCGPEARSGIFRLWFSPMLADFGWLQRCRKGLEMKVLEEAMGRVLLTLPLKQQYVLFMEWFGYFSKQGSECPNLSKSFQIWWRRSFLRGSETNSIECR